MNKTKKMNKIEKNMLILAKLKISVQLDKYYKNGENAKIRKIYDNFH